MTKFTKQPVSLVEYAIFKYPEGLEGWRFYRVEIGGHAESCVRECSIWLPPNLDPSELEDLINRAQRLLSLLDHYADSSRCKEP